MKIEYIQPFINATRKVLSTMASLESKPLKPYLKEESNQIALGDISSVIELTGECNGSIGLSFETKCILKIASGMLGEVYEELDDEVADMVGELVNMISGDARRQLIKLGFSFSAGIPKISKGSDHKLVHSVSERTIVIPFKTATGDFYIETCFDSRKFLE
ncbi:MAG: chemotaxis protein CheX [Proteobacteria bacterium]|nr:chemotaxis protein CheX [Pseudomonadota bacterium]